MSSSSSSNRFDSSPSASPSSASSFRVSQSLSSFPSIEQVWTTLMESSVRMAATLQHQLMAKVNQDLNLGKKPDQDELNAIAKLNADQFIVDSRNLYLKIWNHFDVNQDGYLSKTECQSLTKSFLEHQRSQLPALIQLVIDESSEASNTMMKQMGALDEDIKQLEEKRRQIQKQAVEHAGGVLDELLPDYVVFSNNLWALMDENGDGMVSKQEFLDNYGKACEKLLNLPQLLASLVQ